MTEKPTKFTVFRSVYIALYSKFPAVSVSEKNRLRFDKVSAKVWGIGFLEHGVYAHGTSTSQTDGRTDGRTTYGSNTALVLRASRGKNGVTDKF